MSVFGSQVLELGEGGANRFYVMGYNVTVGEAARGKGMGPRPPSSRGQDLDARTTGGGRAVRDPFLRNARGRRVICVGRWAQDSAILRGTGAWARGWVPAFARTREREVIRGERWRGSPPSPVFTRAGSNLPPSRGKGFVGAGRAVREPPLRGGRWQGWAAGLEGGGRGVRRRLWGLRGSRCLRLRRGG